MTRNFKMVVAALAAVSLTAGTALAGAVERVPTKVKLGFDPRDDADYFEGTVSSPNPTCVKGRKVVIKYLDGDDKLGSDKTDGAGSFELRLDGAAASGTYKAIAKRREVRGIICKKGVDTVEETHDG